MFHLISLFYIFAFANAFDVPLANHKSLFVALRSENENILHHVLRDKRQTTEEQAVQPKLLEPQVYSVSIVSNIQYRYATTVVSNRVANPANVSQEVAFGVTLPEAAFISGFSMTIKDKVYDAYVKEKEEAKKDYEAAKERGESAGHVQLNSRDSNVFTMSVNVEPLGKVTFNLTYEQLLTRTLGTYENVINVNPGQVVKSLSVQVNIKESSNIIQVSVPEFKTGNEIDVNVTENKLATIEHPKPDEVKVTWNPSPDEQKKISEHGANGQFIVKYDVDREANPTQILVDEGYFVHFYAPEDLKTLPKHVTFALDVSGSMGGRKIEQLREALVQILGDMSDQDYFTLVLFSEDIELWTLDGTVGNVSPPGYYGGYYQGEGSSTTTPKPEIKVEKKFIVPATPQNIAKAKQYASTLNETGGTNIIAALRKSVQIAKFGQTDYAKSAEPLIIFLTDGQPNVEMSDTEEIVKTVRKLNTEKYPLFSLAFGDGADYKFLRKLSLTNNGFARNIYVASDTSIQLKNFYKEIASPLLSNVTFQYIPGQIDENSTTKAVFNNFFSGSELVVAGKLSKDVKNLDGKLSGHSIDGDIHIPFPQIVICPPFPFPYDIPVNRSFGHLEKLWAFLHIQQLLDQDAISDETNSTYKQKALDLSLKYSFVTPLTSLVVVKPNETESSDLGKRPIGGDYGLYGPPGAAGMHISLLAGGKAGGLSSLYASPAFAQLPPPFTTMIPQFSTKIPPTPPGVVVEESAQTRYLNLSDITWLNETLEVIFPSSNNTYSVAPPGLPNTEFQICLLPNKTQAYCRHLAHCVLPEIVSSFESFIPYGEECIIDARFVGICCPDLPEVTSTTEVSTSGPDGSTPIPPPTTPPPPPPPTTVR